MSTSPTNIPGGVQFRKPPAAPVTQEALTGALNPEQAARLASLQVLLDKRYDLPPGDVQAMSVYVITGQPTYLPVDDALAVPVQPPASDTPIGDAAAGAAGRGVVLDQSKRRAS